MFEKFSNKKGWIVLKNGEVILKYNYGARGGDWTANGYFDVENFEIMKGDDSLLEESPQFGTVNAKHSIPIITDCYISEGRLFVVIIRKTRRWSHKYHWRVVSK